MATEKTIDDRIKEVQNLLDKSKTEEHLEKEIEKEQSVITFLLSELHKHQNRRKDLEEVLYEMRNSRLEMDQLKKTIEEI